MSRQKINAEQMRLSASVATGVLKALANPERLLLLCRISQSECCVSDLEADLGIHQPTLSQQLGVLRDEGLIAPRRDGKRIYYSISDPKALKLLQLLYTLYCPSA